MTPRRSVPGKMTSYAKVCVSSWMVLCAVPAHHALAQAAPPTAPARLSPPPPPPPVPEQVEEPAPTTSPVTPPPPASEPTRLRFAPTLSVLGLTYGTHGPSWAILPFPSLRAGLRVALLPRSVQDYSGNLSLCVELGADRYRSPSLGPRWAWTLTARSGFAGVTRGGLFLPFLEAYALASVSALGEGSYAGRLGIGINFNAFAVTPRGRRSRLSGLRGGGGRAEVLLLLAALLVPRVELVWTPPTPQDPSAHADLRLGIGF